MRVLIIHQNFPGQFRYLMQNWAGRRGWQILGIGREAAPGMPNIRWEKYSLHREPLKEQHPYLYSMENAVLHGQAVARKLWAVKAGGFTPDVIIAHPGWGETLYVKEVFPDARMVHLCEWYYDRSLPDMHFDPEFPSTVNDCARVHTWNALHALNLLNCDAGVSATRWQRDRHPEALRDKIEVIHEGIHTAALQPDANVGVTTPNGTKLRVGDPVITYVARNLEPYRGFHSFMRVLASVQRQHPTCHAIIVGGDGVSYGKRPQEAENWREKLLGEVEVDAARTHFTGCLPVNLYHRVLQVSAAHVYLTYPFVLSWSMLEAMACGCLVVASRTPPVEEVVRDRENGLLVDFFDYDATAATVLEALRQRERFAALRTAAREQVREEYSLERGMAGYDRLLSRLCG